MTAFRVATLASAYSQKDVFCISAVIQIRPAVRMPRPVTLSGPPAQTGLDGLPPPGFVPSATR
ncbi:hypothetical protein HFP71_33400 [Streptomyces sp. ARC32]